MTYKTVRVSLAALALAAGGLSACGKIAGVGTVTNGPPPAAAAAATAAITPDSSATLPVAIQEFKVTVLPSTTLTAGHKTLVITNTGTVQHELLVFRSNLAPSQYPLFNGNIAEDAPSITKVSDGDNIDPGKTQTRTVDLSTPGTYLFVCNLPGHFHAGMFAQVTVVPAPSLSVALSEFHIDTGVTTVHPGIVNLNLANNGTVQHELLVFRTNLTADQLPLAADGSVLENAPGVNKISDGDNLNPGTTQYRSVDLTQPGTYLFVCNLPGHFHAGMHTTVTVQ
jgi:uncharacterized cupredoxin-like copper-binding protein